VANEQAQNAEREKQISIQQRIIAENADKETKRLNMLSIAQNLALKSVMLEKNPEMMGLLAVQAYNFNKNYDGKPDDPVIYDALNKAYSTLDNDKHYILESYVGECKALAEIDNKLMEANLRGDIEMRTYNNEAGNTILHLSNAILHFSNTYHHLFYKSPINFISFSVSNNQVITGHDNLDVCLWDIGTSESSIKTCLVLKGHKGLMRTAGFSSDSNLMATAGRDSLIIIWNMQTKNPSAVNTLKAPSPTKSVLFCGTDTLISAQENGSIIIWNIKNMKSSTLFSSDIEMPLCLAWNVQKRVLLAGCSNGMLLVFHLNQNSLTQPDKYPVHTSGIDQLVFNNDYSFFATASWDKVVRFYNYHSFCELSEGRAITPGKLDSRVRALIFSNDNRLIASTSDKNIRVWETSSQNLATSICSLLKREMTSDEWNKMIGEEIPYERTCSETP
jgi:hypothetical protein